MPPKPPPPTGKRAIPAGEAHGRILATTTSKSRMKPREIDAAGQSGMRWQEMVTSGARGGRDLGVEAMSRGWSLSFDELALVNTLEPGSG